MAVVLCVVPNERERGALEEACRRAGAAASFVARPEDLDGLPREGVPDLVVVDLGALGAEASGLVLERARDLRRPALLILPEPALASFDLASAGDDFVVAPLRPLELAARIRRLLGKARDASRGQVIQVGDLVIDPERYEVRVAGRPVLLTYKEYELLKLLASHPGRVFTREVLLDRVWGYQYFGGTRTVDVHIRRLRSKLASVSPREYIETVWNVGYRLKEPEE